MPDFEIVRDRDLELWAVVDDQGEIVATFDRMWEAEVAITSGDLDG